MTMIKYIVIMTIIAALVPTAMSSVSTSADAEIALFSRVSDSDGLSISGNGDTAKVELKATNENGKTNKVSDFRLSADNILFIEQNDKVTITDNVDFTRALVTDSNDNEKRIGVSNSGVIDFAGYAQGIYTLDLVVDHSRAYEAIIVIGEQDEQVVDREITRVDNKQITEVETDNNGDGNCDSSYPTVCIKSPPPDLNCGNIPHQNFEVTGSDPHGFDRDNDGIGCESANGEDTPAPTPTPTPEPPTNDPEPPKDPGLPYCDLVPEEYEGGCHDRLDYDEDTGLTSCRDGSKVEDWRDCPDAGKHPDETLPQQTDCEEGQVWDNGACVPKPWLPINEKPATPTPTPSPESTLFGSSTSTPTPVPTPTVLARGLLPTTPSTAIDNPCEAIPEPDIQECKDLPAETLEPTPLPPTQETLLDFPTEETEEIPNVPLEDIEEEEVEEQSGEIDSEGSEDSGGSEGETSE